MSWTLAAGPQEPQSLETPEKVSLEQALAIARERHAMLAAAEQDTQAARAGVVQARSGLYPQVTFRSTYSRFESASTGFSIGRAGASENRETSVNVSQMLWDSGLTTTSVRQSRASLQASRWSQEETWRNVAFQVANAYYGVLRAQELVRLNEAVVDRAQKEVELAETAVEVGTGPPIDILRAQVQVANARVDLISARNQVKTALAQLKNAMGLPWIRDFQVQEPAPLEDSPQSLEDWISRAWEQRPELQRLAATQKVQEQNVRIARLQSQPLFSLNANFQEFLSSSRKVTREWFMGGTISAPLYDAGKTRAMVTQARAQLARTQASEENLRRSIALEVEQAYLALADARERWEAGQQSVALATENLAAQQESYREGVASLLDVNDAQVELTRAETALIQAEYDLELARLALRQAGGDPLVTPAAGPGDKERGGE